MTQTFGAAAGDLGDLLTDFEDILNSGAIARLRKAAALMRSLGGEAKVTATMRTVLSAMKQMDSLPEPTTAEGIQQRGHLMVSMLEAVADLVPGHTEDAAITLLKSNLNDLAWCQKVADVIGATLAVAPKVTE